MIYKSDLKALGLNFIGQYYSLIFTDYFSGPKEEAENSYKLFSAKQRLDFLDWVETNHPDVASDIQQDFESILEEINSFDSLKEN